MPKNVVYIIEWLTEISQTSGITIHWIRSQIVCIVPEFCRAGFCNQKVRQKNQQLHQELCVDKSEQDIKQKIC